MSDSPNTPGYAEQSNISNDSLGVATELHGYWYESANSTRQQAILRVDLTSDQTRIELVDDSNHAVGPWSVVQVSSRIGNIPRKLNFANGSLFETQDNDSVDKLLELSDHSAKTGVLASRLESSWGIALVGVVVVAISLVAFFKIGVPAAARYVAHKLPVSAQEKISEGTLATLDRFLLDPTELSEEQQAEQRASFNRLSQTVSDSGFTYTLHFRKMNGMPNALALPSGDIVVTDALVKLANNQQEIESVMLHEIGHVVHRHGAQAVLRASAVSLIVTLALGDLSGAAELLVGLPVFLMQNSYSQKAELEADEYAFKKMQALGIDTVHFANILTRMTEAESTDTASSSDGGDTSVSEDSASSVDEPVDETSSKGKKIPNYFSTHPSTEERAARARELSKGL